MLIDSIKEDFDLSTSANPLSFNFLNNLDIEPDVIRRLSLLLNRTVKGSDDVYLTPLGKDNDPLVILKHVDDMFDKHKSAINNDLMDLEISNRSKFGPRSISKPWSDRASSLSNYYRESVQTSDFSKFYPPNQNLRPLSVINASGYLKNSTNSGLPFFTKKSKVKQLVVDNYDYYLNRKDPCILFTRTQESGKTRNVWGYPIADTLNEMMYYRPLLDYQKKLSWRSALVGPDQVDLKVSNIMNSSSNTNQYFVSVDFSAYDASVGKHLQRSSFDYISSLFQTQHSKDIDYLYDRFNTIGIVSPSGILSGSHGVPSGATFTNEVDSIAQYLIAKSSNVITEEQFQIQGDDGLYALESNDVKTLLNCFDKSGIEVNEEKSQISSEFCVYLQKMYHKHYSNNGFIGGIYPIYRALNRVIYQERYSDFEDFGLTGKDYYSIRAICILENCKYHPLFKEFVRYVGSLDKYLLSYSKDGLRKYKDMYYKDSGVGGVINNQYGDRVKGLDSFETVKILKDMA